MIADEVVISGVCEPAWSAVADGFSENFADGDLGATSAVFHDGEIVVDLWGGHLDLARTRPWQSDTIVNMWSSTKMLTAFCVLLLHDRGALSIDEPMATYWPEFAANGKDGVLVRNVLGHTAGLPVFDEVVDETTVFDWDECCRRLAAQAPRWEPGDGSGYHAETQGWLLGELVRRVDGRTLGAFARDEIAGPLGLDVHVGVPDDDLGRVAEIAVQRAIVQSPADPELRERSQYSSQRSAGLANTTSWRQAEMPASNGHGNARAMAMAMAPLAMGGVLDGTTWLSAETLERCFEIQSDTVDRILGRQMRLGVGFGLSSPESPLGVNDRTLWWAGWGGSMTVVDVENRMVVSYVMNRMGGEDDFRAARVIFAAHGARGALG